MTKEQIIAAMRESPLSNEELTEIIEAATGLMINGIMVGFTLDLSADAQG